MDDEQIEREELIPIVEGFLVEAFRARADLLTTKRKALDVEVKRLNDEVDQLELKRIRLSNNLKRASVADLRVYHYLFLGRETP